MTVPQFSAVTVKGKSITLGSPLSFRVERTMGSPAAGISAVFQWVPNCPALYEVSADIGGRVTAIVDEQSLNISSAGFLLEIDGRSRAGLLADNEAQPQVYYNVSLRDIFRTNIAPYGFELGIAENPSLSQFVVGKGMSLWEVLSSFCVLTLGAEPMAEDGGVITLRKAGGKTIVFSNRGTLGAVPFISLEDTLRRAGLPSKIYMQTDRSAYGISVSNPLTREYRLSRVRYDTAPQELAHSPQLDAMQRIKKANLASRCVKMEVLGIADVKIGDCAEIQDDCISMQGLFVYSVCHKLGSGAVTTELKLAPRTYL